MLTIETYFRINGGFITAKNFSGPILNPNYIAGSLSVSVNGRQIIDQDLWDYIDQLWGYIVDGICSVSDDSSYAFYFPDQPIKISFEMLNNGLVKVVNDFAGEKSAVVEKKEFLTKFSEAGRSFFEIMKRQIPEHSDTWNNYLDRLASI